jgi:hypothetical protein
MDQNVRSDFITTEAAARRYLALGWRVIPVPAGRKGPAQPGWQDWKLTEADLPRFFGDGRPANVGVVLGHRSGDLVDIDLDSPETLALADHFLPPTRAVFGRPSAPGSHRLYVAPGAAYRKFQDPDGATLLELRTDGEDGGAHQTLFPPSIHPTGERYAWQVFEAPAQVDPAELEKAVRKLAAAALLARYWPKPGSRIRHETALALAGALVRAGWAEEEVADFVEAVARAAGDEEARDRAKDALDTVRRHELGVKTTGLPRLKEFLPPEVVDRLPEWLWPERQAVEELRVKMIRTANAINTTRSILLHAVGRKPPRPTVATLLVDLALSRASLWRSHDDQPFATVDGRRHLRVDDPEFADWLAGIYYSTFNTVVRGEALTTARGTLRAMALFEGPQHRVWVRVGWDEAGGRLYVDLADGSGRAVEIGPDGFRVIPNPPVKFWAPSKTRPLPAPEPDPEGRAPEEWLSRFDLTGDSATLLKGFLVGCLHPEGPYAVGQISGPAGSGKSTLARQVVELIDPRTPALRALPREERDLAIAARRARLLAFTNLSGLPAWLSDALCRLVTDPGLGTRKLYTDEAEATFDERRPILLNGIPDVVGLAGRPDLADRTLRVSLGPIPDSRRLPEAELLAEFERLRPRILGWLYGQVSRALKDRDQVRPRSLPRLADVALWVTAAEPPAERGRFIEALGGARLTEAAEMVEADPVGRALLDLTAGWEPGTERAYGATELYEELTGRARAEGDRLPAGWPRSADALGRRLANLAVLLGRLGLEVRRERAPDRRRGRQWVLRKVAAESVRSVLSGQEVSEGASQVSEDAPQASDLDASRGPSDTLGGGQDTSDASLRQLFGRIREVIE